jgi:hypothetical protein
VNILYICVSKDKRNKDSIKNGYIIQAGLAEVPDETWKQFFFFKYRRGTALRKKKVSIAGNEVLLKIDDGVNIQDYIDIIKSIINDANKLYDKYIKENIKIQNVNNNL